MINTRHVSWKNVFVSGQMFAAMKSDPLVGCFFNASREFIHYLTLNLVITQTKMITNVLKFILPQ